MNERQTRADAPDPHAEFVDAWKRLAEAIGAAWLEPFAQWLTPRRLGYLLFGAIGTLLAIGIATGRMVDVLLIITAAWLAPKLFARSRSSHR